MGLTKRPLITSGIALAGASLIAVTPVASPPVEIQTSRIRLTSTDAPPGPDDFYYVTATGPETYPSPGVSVDPYTLTDLTDNEPAGTFIDTQTVSGSGTYYVSGNSDYYSNTENVIGNVDPASDNPDGYGLPAPGVEQDSFHLTPGGTELFNNFYENLTAQWQVDSPFELGQPGYTDVFTYDPAGNLQFANDFYYDTSNPTDSFDHIITPNGTFDLFGPAANDPGTSSADLPASAVESTGSLADPSQAIAEAIGWAGPEASNATLGLTDLSSGLSQILADLSTLF